MIMYGSGLRLMECLRLRIRDIDFSSNQQDKIEDPTQVFLELFQKALIEGNWSICIDIIEVTEQKTEILFQIDYENFHCISFYFNKLRKLKRSLWDTIDGKYIPPPDHPWRRYNPALHHNHYLEKI